MQLWNWLKYLTVPAQEYKILDKYGGEHMNEL